MNSIEPFKKHKSFSTFIEDSFNLLNPGTTFQANWHIELIARYLERIRTKQLHRLIINIPPRYLKSHTISIAWVAWMLGHNPTTRVIAASHTHRLSKKLSLDTKLLMESDLYKKQFPETALSPEQCAKDYFTTTLHGFRYATSVGAAITGHGADILIVDDPHTPLNVLSSTKRQYVLDWFDHVFLSRLNDKRDGAIVIVMQRLHENDLTGHLIQHGEHPWTVLSLPVIAEEDTYYRLDEFSYQRKANELLHETREDESVLRHLKVALGQKVFSTQYQQQPLGNVDTILHWDWIQYYEQLPEGEPIMQVQSWDTAIKSEAHHDYSVCTHWAIYPSGYYLVDVFRKQMEFPELLRSVAIFAKRYNPDAILIEDHASGQSLIQTLKRDTVLPIIGIRAKLNKLLRFNACMPLFEAKKVFFPRNAEFLDGFLKEVYHFPQTKHDDQVDSLTQCLSWVASHSRKDLELMQSRSC